MPTPRGRLIPIVIVAVAGAIAVGAAAIADRSVGARDSRPAPPGTPELRSRLPVGLWPSDGNEPVVEGGIRGWRRMADHLYHRGTATDDAALARAVVFATYARRAADARREVAFEVSVLNGSYVPAVVAAAWLAPQTPATASADRLAYRDFGIGAETIAVLEAVEALDADPAQAPGWGRQVGLDPARRDFAAIDADELDAEGRARLGALMIDAALDRIHARNPSRG
jgi:hypothetical protein